MPSSARRLPGAWTLIAAALASAPLLWAGCGGGVSTSGSGGSGGAASASQGTGGMGTASTGSTASTSQGAGGMASSSQSTGGVVCGPGTTMCGNGCVDTANDPTNCGMCAKACAAGEVCSMGQCALQCAGGATKCGNVCVDTANDPANCGMCAKACAAGEVCSMGQCSLQCAGGATKCGAACVDTANDPANCGMCGKACAAGEVCSMGQCSLQCAGGATKCGNACVNTANDPANCGMCGKACNQGEVCAMGQCGFQCAGGTTKCGNACVNTANDPANCGMCGNACPGAQNGAAVCAGGNCSYVCTAGFKDCNQNQADGCEVNGQTDVNNCGSCGHVCSIANGTAACINGGCGVGMCASGFGDCNNNPADGCEDVLQTDANNCGSCGHGCQPGEQCSAGACINLYFPSGPQQNVPPASLFGWSLCYQDTYNVNMQAAIPTIMASCNKAKILMACKQAAAPNLQLLAAGLRVDVFFDTNAQSVTHNANGVGWYFNANYSWGFTTAGQSVALGQCDTNAGADRLCWHTVNSAGGYRCGDTTGLNGATDWQRFVYHAD